jgi:meso-butanediol dehydrogenase / (S,S)-butanediol dehydrogenase / diacetyl reductase
MGSGRFSGKVAVVTGAGSGIGAATAWRFWTEGAAVVLTGRTKARLAKVAESLDEERSLVHVSDVSVPEDVERFVADTLARFARIDILVNNAGVGMPGGFLEMPTAEWRRTSDVDVDGAVLPHLLATKGTGRGDMRRLRSSGPGFFRGGDVD